LEHAFAPPLPLHFTGIEVASPLGFGVEAHKNGLTRRVSGIQIESRFSDICDAPVGEIPWTEIDLSPNSNTDSDELMLQLCLPLVDKCIQEKRIFQRYNKQRVGVLAATTTSGVAGFLKTCRVMDPKESQLTLQLSPNLQQHNLMAKLQKKFGFSFCQTISSSCAASSQAIHLARQLIEAKYIDACVVLACDILNPITLLGFRSLQLLDPGICRPFTTERKGINLSEAAVVLFLEKETKVQGPSFGTLRGSHTLSESFHMTQPDPKGNWMMTCMDQACMDANVAPKDLDYINPHGTGTPANDDTEKKALDLFSSRYGLESWLLQNEKVRVDPTKGLTGHPLGTSGALECVLSLLSLKEFGLSNSFGFGGVFASLILGKGQA
jgi:3-oxoacyl-[acyl-carrier-protein] synthase I